MRVYVDVETTGLVAGIHRAVEVGAVAFHGGVEVGSFETLANPGDVYLASAQEEAMNIHGISLEEIRRGPSEVQAAAQFRRFVEDHEGPLHAFGLGFDRQFLCLEPWKVGWPAWEECVQQAATEVMGAAGVLKKHGSGWRWARLEAAMKFFDVPPSTRHRALPDARACALVHQEILNRRHDMELADESRNLIDGGM